jgi:hypothetical protein
VVSAAPVWHQQDLQLLQGGPQQEQQIQLPTANSTLAWPSGTPAAAAVETMAAQLRTTQALLSSTMALTDVSQAAEGGTAGRAPRDMLTRVQQQQQQQQLQAESDYAVFLDELLQLSAEVENAKQPPTMHPMLSVAEGTQQAASSSHGHQEPQQSQQQLAHPDFTGVAAITAAVRAATPAFPAEHILPGASVPLPALLATSEAAAALLASHNAKDIGRNQQLQQQLQRIQLELQRLNRQCEMVTIVVEQIQANLSNVQEQVSCLDKIISG